MPASPYDAGQLVVGPFRSPLNELGYPEHAARQNAGQALGSRLGAALPALAGAGQVHNPAIQWPLVYDEILGFTAPMFAPDGRIAGVVTDGVNPLAGALARLYYRPTGLLLMSAVSNALGEFEFLGVSTLKAERYYVVVFDKDGAPVLNAQIFDYVTPTPV